MSIRIELPAVYVDGVTSEAQATALLVENEVPERSSVDAPAAKAISFDILSTNGSAIDTANTTITVNGEVAYQSGGFVNGWSGTATTSGDDVSFALSKSGSWASESTVTVRVQTQDVTPTDTLDFTYSFTAEDTIAPKVVSAEAVSAKVFRVTFDEDMLAASASGSSDALNPSLYSVAFSPGSDVQAGVSVAPVSVTSISSTVFEVTTDIELTFGRTYTVTCGDIADNSASGNALDPFYRSASFTAWRPPDWPSRRSFDLWSMVSDDDRDGDVSGDLERWVSAVQDIVDLLLWDIDQMQYIWDLDRCPEEWLPYILQDMGNPFDLDLTVTQQRKLAASLVDIYRDKGTARGVINVIRFFLKLEPTISSYNVDSWRLGVDRLGVSTYLAPGETALLYTFTVNFTRALTTAETEIVNQLVEYMKPGHTHYKIIEPSSPTYVDHWMLGESKLGVETILH